MQDDASSFSRHSLSAARQPTRIIWDRNDSLLPDHVYTYQYVYEKKYKPTHKYAMFFECKELPEMKKFYDELNRDIQILREFDAVFTNQDFILEKMVNAYFVPSCTVWYDTEFGGVKDIDKTKNISLVSSYKDWCRLHKERTMLAERYSGSDAVDCYGTYGGGQWVRCASYLNNYRYHIAIENQLSCGYFTEKITNCFMSCTVPSYLGATDIGEYFNLDGIIRVKNIDEVDEVVEKCNEEDYESRKDAILDNYNRVQEYLSLEDYIINHYEALFC